MMRRAIRLAKRRLSQPKYLVIHREGLIKSEKNAMLLVSSKRTHSDLSELRTLIVVLSSFLFGHANRCPVSPLASIAPRTVERTS